MRATCWGRPRVAQVAGLLLCGAWLAACGKATTPGLSDTGFVVPAPESEVGPDQDVPAAADCAMPSDCTPSEDALATADATAADTAQLPGICVADLPMPGEPCGLEGEVRCTNKGARESPWTGSGLCDRPYFVQCQKDTMGTLAWSLHECPGAAALGTAMQAPTCEKKITCVVRSANDHGCQPTMILPKNAPHPGMVKDDDEVTTVTSGHVPHIVYCSADHPLVLGQKAGDPPICSGPGIYQCTTLAKTGALKEQILAVAGDCAKYLQTGTWVLPLTLCQVEYKYCPAPLELCGNQGEEPPKKPECAKTQYDLWCMDQKTYEPFHDPITGEMRCKKDCHEAGALGY